MIVLAIDTAANLCAACVWDTQADRELGRCVRDPGKGHAEMLMAVIGEALHNAGMDYRGIEAVAVSVGPGSFTGIRVGVAAGRGLALALKIRSAGVSTLDALMHQAAEAIPSRPVIAVLDARRGALYLAARDAEGGELAAPSMVTLAEAVALAEETGAVLTGSAAPAVAATAGKPLDIAGSAATADIAVYARLAAGRGFADDRPKPLYLREADARPQQGFTLPRA